MKCEAEDEFIAVYSVGKEERCDNHNSHRSPTDDCCPPVALLAKSAMTTLTVLCWPAYQCAAIKPYIIWHYELWTVHSHTKDRFHLCLLSTIHKAIQLPACPWWLSTFEMPDTPHASRATAPSKTGAARFAAAEAVWSWRIEGPSTRQSEQLEGQLRATMPTGSEHVFKMWVCCLVPNQKFDCSRNQNLQLMFYSYTVVGVMCSKCFEANQRHIETASKMPLQMPDARGCAGQAFKFGCLNQAYSRTSPNHGWSIPDRGSSLESHIKLRHSHRAQQNLALNGLAKSKNSVPLECQHIMHLKFC